MAESEGLAEVPQEVLKKLAALYYRHKKVEPPPGNDIPPWVRNINSMSRVDVEHETRDAIHTCRELKKRVVLLETEGERIIPTVSKRERMRADLLDQWTYMSYYLYTLFRRSGVEVGEEEFDEFIRERTDSRTFFTNLSRR